MRASPRFCSRISRCVLFAFVVFVLIHAGMAQSPAAKSEQPNVRPTPKSVGVADSTSLWPGGVIYYQIVNGSSAVTTALSTFNADFTITINGTPTPVVQWVNGTGSGTYVQINLNSSDLTGACDVNTIGYPGSNKVVTMGGSINCSISTILHEMGHIVG